MIVRTKTRAEGGITEKELIELKKVSECWIKNAMRTDSVNPEKIVPAIEKLYEVSGLKKPRVVVVSSPAMMAFAGGAAAWIWYCRKNKSFLSTVAATVAATRAATFAATDAATFDATFAATRAATDAATRGMVEACRLLAGSGGLECAKKWYSFYQGGNMWSAYPSYISGMRDIIGLDLPEYEKYAAWEECAKEGGYRFLHEEFCIVSDFPEILHVNSQNQPHCEDGPSHRWRDGWELYHLNGVKVPKWLVLTTPEKLNPKEYAKIENVEIRREFVRKIGAERLIKGLGGKILDTRGDYELLSVDLGLPERCKALKMKNPSIGVYHIEWVSKDCKTVQEALNFRASGLKSQKGKWSPTILT